MADVDALLRAGADKVGAEHRRDRPARTARARRRASSARQCVVLSVDARRLPRVAPTASGFEVTTHGGRRGTGIDAVDWARRAVDLGAGEILLNSMDADGTKAGFDLELIRLVRAAVTVPVIASGGAGRLSTSPRPSRRAPTRCCGQRLPLRRPEDRRGEGGPARGRLPGPVNARGRAPEPGDGTRSGGLDTSSAGGLTVADAGGGHGGADDAGVVEEGGGDDLGADAGQQRHPLVAIPC